jgi:hypothetical protein
VLLEVDALDEEETALHPLEGNPSLCASRRIPTSRNLSRLVRGRCPGWLLVGFSVDVVVGHNSSSFH